MKAIAGIESNLVLRRITFQLALILSTQQICRAQVYAPVFKSVEVQATIAPLGDILVGKFFGHMSVAAISKSERAIYFFVPDSMENLILTNVVSLPDTPVAMSAGNELSIDTTRSENESMELAVLMKPGYACLVRFGIDGEPIVSPAIKVDTLSTGIRIVDLEAAGRLDIVTYGRFSLGIGVSRGSAKWTFGPSLQLRGTIGTVPFDDVAFADFNGDLVPDMAALDWVNHKLLIFYGRGDGTFAQPVAFPLPGEPSVLSVEDLNGNGYPDIVVGYTRHDRIDIFTGDGFGRFFHKQTLKTYGPVSEFATADFTGDGTTDIAAYSRESDQVTLFSYDPLIRSFKYVGLVGIGHAYRHIVPVYFANRFKADLVASSPTDRFLKVLKSSVTFIKSPDILIPVPAGSEFVRACGPDTSNHLVVADSTGNISARYFSGPNVMDVQTAVDWNVGGRPATMSLVAKKPVSILVSHRDSGLLSIFEMSDSGNGFREIDAEAPSSPVAVQGELSGDSVVIAAAYFGQSDSTVDLSFFGSTRGSNEVIERDYSLRGKFSRDPAALSMDPYPVFISLSSVDTDSVALSVTQGLNEKRPIVDTIMASSADLAGRSPSGLPYLATVVSDTLNVYEMYFRERGKLESHLVSRIGFQGHDLNGVRIAEKDSVVLVAVSDTIRNEVALYRSRDGNTRLVKSWRVSSDPSDIAISTEQDRIYFLNESESYVSVHSY